MEEKLDKVCKEVRDIYENYYFFYLKDKPEYLKAIGDRVESAIRVLYRDNYNIEMFMILDDHEFISPRCKWCRRTEFYEAIILARDIDESINNSNFLKDISDYFNALKSALIAAYISWSGAKTKVSFQDNQRDPLSQLFFTLYGHFMSNYNVDLYIKYNLPGITIEPEDNVTEQNNYSGQEILNYYKKIAKLELILYRFLYSGIRVIYFKKPELNLEKLIERNKRASI